MGQVWVLAWIGVSSAALPPATGDTGSPTTDTDSGYGTPTTDSSAPPCVDCLGGAASDAGDPGGSPCDQGCATQGRMSPLLALLPALALARRRRSAPRV